MELDKIKQLMDQFEDSDIRELQIDDQDFHLYLSKNKQNRPVAKVEKTEGTSKQTVKSETVTEEQKPVADLTPVKSPLVGVVYLQAKPGQAPYVKVGSTVKKGQTICIIEAMKMMTEVKSTVSGVVKEVKVENEDLVEVDQPLIMVEE